jgi:hypothetical protein
MSYFKKVKIGDKLYGIVFGAGRVTQVFEDSHYKFMVTFKNGYEVPYTEDGIPGWGNFKKQTIFYKKDIDLTDIDFLPVTKVLSAKKIIKLREKNKLEMRLPSGAWAKISKCPVEYIEQMLEQENYHLFRKKD